MLAGMEQAKHLEKTLRCRHCFRSGSATLETNATGALALLALSEGFHRRARVPLSLPPAIVCDCGTVQPDPVDQDGSVRDCLRAANLFQPKPISGVSSPISRVVRMATRRPPMAS